MGLTDAKLDYAGHQGVQPGGMQRDAHRRKKKGWAAGEEGVAGTEGGVGNVKKKPYQKEGADEEAWLTEPNAVQQRGANRKKKVLNIDNGNGEKQELWGGETTLPGVRKGHRAPNPRKKWEVTGRRGTQGLPRVTCKNTSQQNGKTNAGENS